MSGASKAVQEAYASLSLVVGAGGKEALDLLPRVRQLNAQVVDLYSVAFKTLHYNRVNWVLSEGFLTVSAARMSACS